MKQNTILTITKTFQSKDEFLETYIGSKFLNLNLGKQESKFLVFILKNLSQRNTIVISPTFRKSAGFDLSVSQPTVSRYLSSLISKGILKPITDEMREHGDMYINNIYFVDPNIVGKGPFREVKKVNFTFENKFSM